MAMTRRGVAVGTAAVAAAGGLAACTDLGGTAKAPLKIDHPVTVSVLVNGAFAGPSADIIRQQSERVFRAAQPNITIDFQGAGVDGADYLAKMIALTVAGTGPDIVYSGLWAMPSMAAKNISRPIDDLVKADGSFKPGDFFDVHWNAWKFDGKQRAVPWQGGPLVSYYNKDLFAAAGAAVPTDASWTWDAWRDAGNKLKRTMATGTHGGDARWPTELGNWQPWIYDSGGEILDKAMTKCLLDSPKALAGFQTMADFIHRDQIAPRPQDAAGQTNRQHFMNSRYAIIILNRQGSSAEGFIQPWVAVAPLPKGPAGRFSQSPFDGFGMGSGTKEPVAAWEVLKFRTGDALRRALHSQGWGGVPAIKATATSQEYLNEKLPPEWNKLFVDSMSIVRLPPPTPKWSDVEPLVTQVYEQIQRGDVAPAAAMKELVPRVNALLQAP